MEILKVVEAYDGRLPIFNVVRVVLACDNCGDQKHEIIKSFDTFEEASDYCNSHTSNVKVKDNITPCGEEDPCS